AQILDPDRAVFDVKARVPRRSAGIGDRHVDLGATSNQHRSGLGELVNGDRFALDDDELELRVRPVTSVSQSLGQDHSASSPNSYPGRWEPRNLRGARPPGAERSE